MQLHENKYINFLLRILYIIFIAALAYFCVKYLFRWLLPIIIAYLLSCLIARPVNFLSRKKVLPRKLAAGLFTLLIVSLVGFLLYVIISRLIVEGVGFVNDLPGVLSELPGKLEGVTDFIEDIASHLPAWLKETQLFSLEGIIASIELPQVNVQDVVASVGRAVSSVPGMFITIIFVFMSTYFLTAERVSIVGFIERQMGGDSFTAIKRLKGFLVSSVGKWLRAQGILISITFVILCIGMLVLRQPYALLLALLIALIDALPILGVGTVLIPWAVIDLLSGSFGHAAALMIIYVVVLIVRNALEPRIVGGQLGLHPFVVLLCIYFGFRIGGFWGMFLLPVIVLSVIKLQEWEYIHLWR